MIIINADDYGCSHEINRAIRDCFLLGKIDRATLMINMPYTDEAVNMAFENGYAHKIGLHLNLTSGIPLTKVCETSILTSGEEGAFNNLFYKIDRTKRIFLSPKLSQIIRIEISAQMQKYIDYGLPLMHMDSHHHVHTNLSIVGIVIDEGMKHEFQSIRICRTYPEIAESKAKSIYKYYINKRFAKINHDFQVSKCFMLQAKDFKYTDFKWYNKECVVELECHPIYDEEGNMMDGVDRCISTKNSNTKRTIEQLINEVKKIREGITH